MKIYINPNPIDITFENLTYSVLSKDVKGGRNFILKGLSGQFKSGQLTAILGPSGAGKTTLLNVLTGFKYSGYIGGAIRIGDNSRGIEGDYFDRNAVCYIPQSDDHLSPFFTVDEIMTMVAHLKLAGTLSTNRKQEIIGDILELNNLTKAKDTLCGKLSFGEKKRLAIALELINNPSVMFLDKPTSGLDSVNCHRCVTTLNHLAQSGRTIVCTIDQPSAQIFEMFDHVYVLATGMCIYRGSPGDVIPFLRSVRLECPQHYNPADFIIEVANGQYGRFNSHLVAIAGKPIQRNDTSSDGASTSASTSIGKRTSNFEIINDRQRFDELNKGPTEFRRFFVLLQKCALKSCRDSTFSIMKMVLHVLVGSLIGIFYADCENNADKKTTSNTEFLIISLLYLSYTSTMPAIMKFPTELNVVKKERLNNWYRLSTFYYAYIVMNILTQVVFTLLYVTPVHYFSSQLSGDTIFLKFSFICLLTNLVSESCGLCLGTIVTNVGGLFFGTFYTILLLSLCGYFTWFRYMPTILYYLSYCGHLRYAFDAMLQATYGYGIYHRTEDCQTSIFRGINWFPNEVMNDFGVNGNRYFVDALMLLGFVVLFYEINFISVRRKVRNLRLDHRPPKFDFR